ncbi:MAG: ribosome maturation factor RimP [Actinomycetota bacterium]
MARLEIDTSIHAICEAVAEDCGCELVDVGFSGSRRRRVLEVVVDREGGVDMDLIVEVSRRLSEALDERDPIEGSYTLEVASAGLERPLIKPADFVRFAGREAKIVCHQEVDGKNQFVGVIRPGDDESFIVELEGGLEVRVPYPAVKKAHLTVDWEEELGRR